MDIETLQGRLVELNDKSQELRAKATAEKRDLTVEEEGQMTAALDEFKLVEGRIAQLSELDAQTERLNKGTGRKTEPDQTIKLEGDEQGNTQLSRQLPRDTANLSTRPSIRAINTGEKNGGFRSLGEMAVAVRFASLRERGQIDPRLERLAAASTYGNEASGTDGGFAIPPDFRTSIMEKVMGEDSLLSRCDQIFTSGNTFTCPADETTPWQTTGGIQAYWDNEAVAATQSKPSLEGKTVKLNKIRALVPMTEELLEDAPAMDAYLKRKAPAKIAFKVNLAIIQGTGAGQPLGILNSAATVSVAKETSQVADTLVGNNVIKMYSRMPAANRLNAVWLINQDIEPQLYKLSVPGTDNEGNSVTGWGGLIYMPPGGISGAPYGTLFGRPVVPTQACETLGDKGDIIFADMSQYLALLKSGPNPRVETSMHLWFDQDLMAFKFVLRIGGMPWWSSSISGRDGAPQTYSPFVTLDAR
jgi:HK97 family phage major capsid protein